MNQNDEGRVNTCNAQPEKTPEREKIDSVYRAVHGLSLDYEFAAERLRDSLAIIRELVDCHRESGDRAAVVQAVRISNAWAKADAFIEYVQTANRK